MPLGTQCAKLSYCTRICMRENNVMMLVEIQRELNATKSESVISMGESWQKTCTETHSSGDGLRPLCLSLVHSTPLIGFSASI